MAVREYKDEKGEIFWKAYACVRSKINPSIRIQRTKFGFKTQKQAEREECKLLRECQSAVLDQEAKGSCWGAVVDEFEKYLVSPQAITLQETTRQDYVAAVQKHTKSWWQRSAASISIIDLRELFSQLKTQGLSVGHLKKIKMVVHRIFIFGMERRMILGVFQCPTIGVKFSKEEEKKPEILTISQIRLLLGNARKLDHPWYPIWALALLTGMRSGELYALLWTDIDWENNVITVSKSYNNRQRLINGGIKSTKAGYWRAIPISSQLKMLLQEIKATAGDRSQILPRFWQWSKGLQARELRKFCMGVGLPSIRFHALRACFATQLIRNGIPPIQIQKICGWKDLKTMQRYIRLAGIEIEGATEGLRVLPDIKAIEQASSFIQEEAITLSSQNPC